MKKLIFSIIFLASAAAVWAQDEAIFSHYNIAPIIVNPSYAGFEEAHQILFNARAQWTSFPDAPVTLGVQYNGPIGKTFGLGIGVLTESAAQMTRLRARLNYAFRFDVTQDLKMSAGFSTEFHQISVGNNVLNENFYEAGDRIIEGLVDGQRIFDASFGVYGTYRQKTFGGIALTNLVEARLDDIETDNTDDDGSFLSYYVVMAGHEFEFENAGFTIEPSIMFREVKGSPSMVDFNVKAGFLDDQVIAGLSYRTIGAVGVLLGTEINNFNMYYTFDLSTQEFQKFTSGTHELTLAFGFKGKDERGQPRR